MLKQVRICDVCDNNKVREDLSCVICHKELCGECYRTCPLTIGGRRQVNFIFCRECHEEAIKLIGTEQDPDQEVIKEVFRKMGEIFVNDFKKGIIANNLERGNVDINGKSHQ